MEQNIVIERHYLTPQMYREIYIGYPYYFTNSNPQPQSQSYVPFINQTPIFPRTNNTNVSTSTHTTANNNIPNTQAPVEIRNLINNLINNNTPFQLEVSNLPIERILNQFRAEINANQTNANQNANQNANNSSINLANINNISSVNIFSSLHTNSVNASSSYNSNANSSSEVCSICQTDFEGSDIVRRLNNCSHLFHLNCVDTWLSNHSTCPTCRNNLTNDMTENNSSDDDDEEEDEEEDDDDDDRFDKSSDIDVAEERIGGGGQSSLAAALSCRRGARGARGSRVIGRKRRSITHYKSCSFCADFYRICKRRRTYAFYFGYPVTTISCKPEVNL